jgi:dodecin
MSGTYKLVRLVGTSNASFSEAVKNAVAEASKTIRHMDWFEVIEQRGMIRNGQVLEFQVTVNIGFKIEHGELV